MAIRVTCPHCATLSLVADQHVGMQVQCSRCNQLFTAAPPVQPAPVAAPVPPAGARGGPHGTLVEGRRPDPPVPAPAPATSKRSTNLVATVEQYCELLTRSRLHSADAVRSIQQRWQSVAIRPTNLSDFSAWLVARDYLTAYQAELLGEGRADNFFLNDYQILERIGKGRVAGVYKAKHKDGPVVALKVLPPSRAKDPAMLARFQREARLAMQLNHPAIVRTIDCGEHRTLHYLVMEYLDGVTLDEVLTQRGRLAPREAARLGLLIALGLQYICEQGLVHRDLKPANLMISPKPAPQENTMRCAPKILDIGLGREMFDSDAGAGEELTREGAILGTPEYMAPEQARDARSADIRADLYALGCTLYHCLAGQPPFTADTLVRLILRHANEKPKPLPEVNSHVPEPLDRIVQTLLAKDPAQRYQTPGQAAEALKPLVGAAR